MNDLQNLDATIQNTLMDVVNTIISFIPQLIAGLIILLVGWIVASLLKTATKKLLNSMDISHYMDQAGVRKQKHQHAWIEVLAQLVFWTIIVIFLVPTFQAWGLTEITDLLNQIFLYLPRVFAAVVLGFVGYMVANLAAKVVSSAASNFGKKIAQVLSALAKYSILIFTVLLVMSVLGIAAALIQTFFAAIMFAFAFAFALAVGLAFGLGGQETARQLLNQMMQSGKQAAQTIQKRK